MWESLREFLENLGNRDSGLLRDLALGLLGGVSRLACDHRKYAGISLQFWYDLFRGCLMATTVVLLVETAAESLCIVGTPAVALFSGCGFFAYEILNAFKRTIKAIIEGYIKGFLK